MKVKRIQHHQTSFTTNAKKKKKKSLDRKHKSRERPTENKLITILKMVIGSLLFNCSDVSDSVIPWTAAHQASLSFTISWSLLKFMSIASMMPSNHLILYHLLFLLPSIFPSINVFSNESTFPSSGQTIGASALASGLSMTIQG